MKEIVLINNPPFRWQTKIYKKYSNRFKEDIWILHKAGTLKDGLYCNEIYDFYFTETENNTLIAHNISGFNNHTVFNKQDKDYKEVFDYVMNNKRAIDFNNDNLNYLLFISVMPSKCKIINIERLPNNKDELKARIIKTERMITTGDKNFKCLVFDNIDELNYWKNKAENYFKKEVYEHKPFASVSSNNGSRKNGQYFTPDNKADELFSKIKTLNKNDLLADICCGNGSLLKAAERAGHPKNNLIGYDIDIDCIKQLQREGYKCFCLDILKRDPFDNLKQ